MAWIEARGFALALVLIALLIVGALAMVAVTRYSLGPILSGDGSQASPGVAGIAAARSAEAKLIAGALWAAIQSSAASACGTPVSVEGSYSKAGLSASGQSSPARWSVPSGAATLVADCTTGAYKPSQPVLFTVAGTTPDVMGVRVQLQVDPSRRSTLTCSMDGGATFSPC